VICRLAVGAQGILEDPGVQDTHHESRYGEERWRSGTLPTDYRFTGQRSVSSIKLYQGGARFYETGERFHDHTRSE
jgi:hypothetical protein